MSGLVQAASAFSRAWVRLYTARLPETLRNTRRAEVDADLWEHQQDRLASRTAAGTVATEIVLRTCFGVLDDLAWRFEVLGVTRRRSTHGRTPMLQFTSRQTQWMGLAGLAGGLLWAVQFSFLVQGHRVDRPIAWGLGLPAVIAALLLVGLIGFLASYRERMGRKGTIGVLLLITSMASYFLANTLLGALPAGQVRSMLGVAVSIGFAILPIPGFVLVGLAMRGAARAGAFLVAIVGPLSAFLPFMLADFLPIPPRWTRPPVSLGYFIYFMLVAVWLAAAGYSTYRQAQRPA
jgi:hypothetical protein